MTKQEEQATVLSTTTGLGGTSFVTVLTSTEDGAINQRMECLGPTAGPGSIHGSPR